MLDPQVVAFAGIAALLTVTPGADTMLVIRNVSQRGRRAGYLATLGICCGVFVHAAFSALGISLIIASSAIAFEMMRFAGAGYLVWLGLKSLRDGWRGRNLLVDASTTKTGQRQAFLEGFITNLLNPKVVIFYLAFLPQFISAGDAVFAKSMLLATIHFIEGIVWLGLVAWFLSRLLHWLRRPAFVRGLDYASGGVLTAFGLMLALKSRDQLL